MFEQEPKLFAFWGASGHAKVLAEIVALRKAKVVAFFENDRNRASPIHHVPVYYGEGGFREWLSSIPSPNSIAALAAIGGTGGRYRLHYLDLFAKSGLQTPSLIHPAAWVSPTASIGRNCHILAGAKVSTDVTIGDATIINTSACVDHECVLAEGVHVGPGAVLCGCVVAERNVFIGAGAVILPRVTLGESAIVGAGAVVTGDVPPFTVAAGVPARILKERTDALS